MFTEKLGKHSYAVMKDAGQSHDKRFRIVVSFLREGFRRGGKHAADMVADSPAGRRSFDKSDGKGHSRRVLQLSCFPVCSQKTCAEKLMRMAWPRNEGSNHFCFFLTSSGQILVFLVLLFFSSVRSC